MRIKITCRCGAIFEIVSNSRHKIKDVVCNSCGKPLPDGASESLYDLLDAYSRFCGAISQKDLYEFSISGNG